jgi:hypothetical protein
VPRCGDPHAGGCVCAADDRYGMCWDWNLKTWNV